MPILKQNTLAKADTQLVVNKAKQLPHGQFEAVLSTDALDNHGEKVSIKGIEVKKGKNYKMHYNHLTSGLNLPIGKWLKVWKSDNKLMGIGQIDLEDDFAVKIYKKILGGFIDSMSIGFFPKEYDGETSTWTLSRLHEASVVGEPANEEAVVTQKELGFTTDEFKQSLKVKLKAVADEDENDTAEPAEEPEPPEEQRSEAGAADNAEVKAAIEELKTKVGALEAAAKAANENQSVKKLIKVRLAGKEVDKSAESLNQVIKVKLKETQ